MEIIDRLNEILSEFKNKFPEWESIYLLKRQTTKSGSEILRIY